MAFLYINSKGQPHRKHSYSAGNTWDQSPKKYYLQKVLGWREINDKARFEFGKALETAIQHYHEHNGEGAVECFIAEWKQHEKNLNLKFTRVEKDWVTLLKTGVEMIKLYAIRQPSLPIPMGGQTIFQRSITKEIFPGDPNYGEIEDEGKLDIIAYVDPCHPMLPKLDWKPEYGALRPVIIDIKTAGSDFPSEYGMAKFDSQLRRYSWLSGIRDAALLWFTKKAHKLEKGYSITLLEDAGDFKAGQEMVIAQVCKDGDKIFLLANDFMIEEMERFQGKKDDGKIDQTNIAKARRDQWLIDHGTVVCERQVTKQRLQFNAGYITIESAEEAGEIAGAQVVGIVNASKTNRWPNKFGVRYPHDDSSDPYFRAFIRNDEAYRKTAFVKSDDATLDDMFESDNERGDQ